MKLKISDEIELKLLSEEYASDMFDVIDSEREYLRIWLPFVDRMRNISDCQVAVKRLACGDNKQFCIFRNGRFVGLVGFKNTDMDDRKTEIGYWLSQYAQKNGIMIRSVAALIDYAFNEQNLNRILIKAAIDNNLSRTIPEKLGFVLEGIEREGELLVDNKYTDIAVYSLLKREYNK